MTSMIAPLGRLRTQRRSPAVFSFGFSAGCAAACGLLQREDPDPSAPAATGPGPSGRRPRGHRPRPA